MNQDNGSTQKPASKTEKTYHLQLVWPHRAQILLAISLSGALLSIVIQIALTALSHDDIGFVTGARLAGAVFLAIMALIFQFIGIRKMSAMTTENAQVYIKNIDDDQTAIIVLAIIGCVGSIIAPLLTCSICLNKESSIVEDLAELVIIALNILSYLVMPIAIKNFVRRASNEMDSANKKLNNSSNTQ
ncbi:MAG: hypothetical protein Q4D22_04365 [Candidatus Saccharibacteria bacterium]|nr:hypothetical protein [Candidatus Saccharibacteria bacterium]